MVTEIVRNQFEILDTPEILDKLLYFSAPVAISFILIILAAGLSRILPSVTFCGQKLYLLEFKFTFFLK